MPYELDQKLVLEFIALSTSKHAARFIMDLTKVLAILIENLVFM